MDILALVRDGVREVAALAAEEGGEAAAEPFQINLFWVIVAATTFILFFVLIREFALAGLQKTLDDRRERIEQGLKDAEQARRDRESAEQERLAALQEARREANEIINRAQKVAAGDARAGHRRHPRGARPAARSARPPRSRRRSSGPSRSCAVRSPTSPSLAAGRVVGDSMTSRPPAQARRGLPGRLRRRRVEQLMSRPVAAARRYAEAAFQVALAEDQLDRWKADLDAAVDMLGRPDVEPTVHSPAVPLTERVEIVRPAAGAPDRPRALRLVDPRGRARQGARPARASARSTPGSLNAHRGVVVATVTSAVPLTADETAAIRSRVEAMAGSRVELTHGGRTRTSSAA